MDEGPDMELDGLMALHSQGLGSRNSRMGVGQRLRQRKPPDKAVLPIDNGPEVQLKRQMAQLSLDMLWRRGAMSQSQVYAWLAGRFGCCLEEAHVERMDDPEMLDRVVEVCDEYLGSVLP